jgi:hypothetical protein
MKYWLQDIIWKLEPKTKRFNNGFWTGRIDAFTEVQEWLEIVADAKTKKEMETHLNYVLELIKYRQQIESQK